MKRTININKQIGCKTLIYPDSQPHVQITEISQDDTIQLICSIVDTNHLIYLLQSTDIIDRAGAYKSELVIPYLLGARFDRLMQEGDSFDLQIIAKLINSCKFEKVTILDVHSEVSTQLINNSENYIEDNLFTSYKKENVVLICPDKGARKKVPFLRKKLEAISDVVYCEKNRDLQSGRISLEVLEPEKCTNQNCVIIDDLCDGGGTFLEIASQINAKHLTLIVTHGIFSRGLEVFENKFDQIIVTDSFKNIEHKLVHQIKLKF